MLLFSFPRLRYLLPAILALVLQAFAPAMPAHAQTPVKMRLDWLVNGYHAPFYVALEKGWYKDAGLDVTLEPGRGSGDTLKLVAAGNAELGFASSSAAAKAAADGVPIMVVSVLLQKTGMGIASFDSANIHAPKDLEGKKIGIVPEDGASRLLPAFMKINGVDASKVQIVNLTFATQIASLLTGNVDAITGYVMGEYLGAQSGGNGRKVNWLSYDDYGIKMYSNGIITQPDYLKDHPQVIDAFLKATMKGIEWTVQNPDAAIDILSKYTDTDKATLKQQLMVAIPLFSNGDQFDAAGLGKMTDAKWETTQNLMVQYGGQTKVVPPESLYTTQFVK